MVLVGVVVMFSITRTTYNAVSVHGSRRPCYNGAAVYLSLGDYKYDTDCTYVSFSSQNLCHLVLINMIQTVYEPV